MAGLKCPECGAGADKTPDGSYAHCASCNTIFEPDKQGSSEKGTAHPDHESKDKKKDEANKEDVEKKKQEGGRDSVEDKAT